MDMKRFFIPIAVPALILSLWTTPSRSRADSITLFEMQTLANAMESCVFDIDRYVTLENLNDLSATNTVFPFDSIRQNGGVYSIFPSTGTFLPRKDFANGQGLQWNGPYTTYQSERVQQDTTPYDQGSPLDRWNNPYYLFNPLGLLRGDQGIITQELYGDQFDRYAIVSLGPDGIMNSNDIIYLFGGGLDGSHLTSISGSAVDLISPPLSTPEYVIEAGTSITLRGVNLGSSPFNRTVMFGATPITDVVSWSPRSVVVNVPPSLTGTENFSILIGSTAVGSLKATITGAHTGITNWNDY